MLIPGLVMLGSQAAGRVVGRVERARVARRRRVDLAQALAPAGLRLPAGVDAAGLLDAARLQFIRMQSAWDASDDATLRKLTTPQMFSELREQLPLPDAPPNRTEVLSVQARLLAFDDLGSDWLATVEFSGMIREQPEQAAEPFRELWLLTRTPAMTGDALPWRLARQQALL